jgi:hypothetical protein
MQISIFRLQKTRSRSTRFATSCACFDKTYLSLSNSAPLTSRVWSCSSSYNFVTKSGNFWITQLVSRLITLLYDSLQLLPKPEVTKIITKLFGESGILASEDQVTFDEIRDELTHSYGRNCLAVLRPLSLPLLWCNPSHLWYGEMTTS